jgi:predicted nucleic acid-binding protein
MGSGRSRKSLVKLVLDASVILKLVLIPKEPFREKALEIIKSFGDGLIKITLPDFWKLEVGNALIWKDPENYVEFYSFLLESGFLTYNFTNNDLVEVGMFAQNYHVSFYDSAYHYLAKLTNSTLITSDTKYFEKTKNIGNIALLKDFKI